MNDNQFWISKWANKHLDSKHSKLYAHGTPVHKMGLFDASSNHTLPLEGNQATPAPGDL